MKKLLSLILFGVLAMGSTPYDTLPLNVTGLQSWWDFSNAASITTVSGKISQINDRSPNGFTLVQATTANQPTLTSGCLNGLSCGTFTSTGPTYLTSSSLTYSVGLSSAISIFAVSSTTSTTTEQMLLYTGSNAGSRISFQAPNSATQLAFVYNQGINAVNMTSTTAPTIYDGLATASGTNFVYANGNLVGSNAAAVAVASSCPVTLGASISGGTCTATSAFPLRGTLEEVLVYNTQLSTSARQLVEGYLACKWGLQANLPATHPYANTCPYYPNFLNIGGS